MCGSGEPIKDSSGKPIFEKDGFGNNIPGTEKRETCSVMKVVEDWKREYGWFNLKQTVSNFGRWRLAALAMSHFVKIDNKYVKLNAAADTDPRMPAEHKCS